MRTHRDPVLLAAASDAAQLHEQLAAIDIDVPLRSEGRTTEQEERWSIVHALGTSAADLRYPLRLLHGDRPDFQLEMAGRVIGIEHTNIIPVDYAHELALRERHYPDEAFFVPRHRPGEPKRTRAEILAAIAAEARDPISVAGDGWCGTQSAEREWVDAVIAGVEAKARRVRVDAGLNGLWLLAYEHWPLPHVDATSALDLLVSDGRWSAAAVGFERVLVLDDHHLWDIEGSRSRVLSLRRL